MSIGKESPGFPIQKLALAINAWLPEDIRVLSAARVTSGFHARFDAKGKQYRYLVWNHLAMNPLIRHTAWHVPRKLDIKAMRQAAAAFSANTISNRLQRIRDTKKDSTVRTLNRCDVRKNGSLLTFIIEGDGFLYRMCRGIVGTVVQAGQGRFSPEQIAGMLKAKDRRMGGMSAPAHGLVLWKVFYK